MIFKHNEPKLKVLSRKKVKVVPADGSEPFTVIEETYNKDIFFPLEEETKAEARKRIKAEAKHSEEGINAF